MRKFIYLLFALLTFACNNEEDVFSEENNKCFHSMEEFNAFVHNAINESFPKQTRATEGSSISSTQIIECIKRAAIAKGIEFKVENEGTDNEFISFASTDPNIRESVACIDFHLFTDYNLPNSGIRMILTIPYSYHAINKIITGVGMPTDCPDIPKGCNYFRDYKTSEMGASHSNHSVYGYWSGTLTVFHNGKDHTITYKRLNGESEEF